MTFDKPLNRNCPWMRFSGSIGIDQRHFKCNRCGAFQTVFFRDGVEQMARVQGRFVRLHRRCNLSG